MSFNKNLLNLIKEVSCFKLQEFYDVDELVFEYQWKWSNDKKMFLETDETVNFLTLTFVSEECAFQKDILKTEFDFPKLLKLLNEINNCFKNKEYNVNKILIKNNFNKVTMGD